MPGIDATNPNIPLSVTPFQAPNVLQSVAAINQLKSNQLNQQLVQQEIQKQNAEQQQQQLALAGTKAANLAIQGAIDPSTGQPDLDRAANSLDAGGYHQQAIALREQADTLTKSHLEAQQAKLAFGASQAKMIADTYAAVKDSSDPAAAYQVANASLAARGVDTSKIPPTYDPATVDNYIQTGYGHEANLKNQLTTAQTGEAASKGALDTASIPKATAEGQIAQTKAAAQTSALAAFKANPQQGAAVIDSVLPPTLDKAANQSYKANWLAAMISGGPDAAQAVVDKATAHAAELSQKLNPAIRNAAISDDVSKGVAVENATAPLKEKVAIDTARAMNGAGNPALANTPPHLQLPAVNAAQKAGSDFATATNAANEMQSIVDLMKGGNKVAYSYAPTTGVLTINNANGVKRVNMAEIASYGGAGSDLDKVQNFFGKHVTGESIDSDIVNSMENLHQTLYGNAKDNYRNQVSNINSNFTTNFDPEKLIKGVKGPAVAGSAAPIVQHSPSTGAYRYSTDGGKTWQAGQPPQ